MQLKWRSNHQIPKMSLKYISDTLPYSRCLWNPLLEGSSPLPKDSALDFRTHGKAHIIETSTVLQGHIKTRGLRFLDGSGHSRACTILLCEERDPEAVCMKIQ